MKTPHGIALIALVTFAFPVAAFAQVSLDSQGSANAGADAGANNASIKARIQADYELRMKNMRENQDNRNLMLGGRTVMASTTQTERMDIRDERRQEIRDIREDGRTTWKNATDTDDRREIRRDMRFDIFKVRKDALVSQLNISIGNLVQIQGRISERIGQAEQNGHDMTSPKALMTTAQAKIDAAQTAIAAVAAYTLPATTTASITASTTVDLIRPRELGAAAIKAVNDARKTLQEVVIAIAHSIGWKVGADGRVAASSTIAQ